MDKVTIISSIIMATLGLAIVFVIFAPFYIAYNIYDRNLGWGITIIWTWILLLFGTYIIIKLMDKDEKPKMKKTNGVGDRVDIRTGYYQKYK